MFNLSTLGNGSLHSYMFHPLVVQTRPKHNGPRNRDVVLHPFTFDTADVPTGVTSMTLARKLRIDAIVYQCQRLELVPRDGGGRLGRPSRKLWMKMIENGEYPKNDEFF